MSLRAGLQRLDSIGSFLPTSVFTDGTRRSLAVAWANVRVERPFSDRVKASVSAGITRGAPTQDNATRLTGNRNYSFIENYESTAFEAAASMSAQVLERFTVKAAVDYQADLQRALFFTQEFFVREGSTQPGDKVELIGAENVRNFTLTNFGAFLQGSGAPISSLPRFNVAGTFRVDVPNTFPLQYSWRLGAAYRLTDAVVVKVIGGRAFQMPSGVMLYALTGLGNSINVVGNRTQTSISPIAPQVVHSVEAVLSAQPAKAITFDVAVFYQALDNPIAFQQIANNFIARNRGPQAIAGAEVNLRLTTERVSPYASFSTQLQLPDDDLLNGNSAVTFALPGFPSLVASGGVNVKMPELFLRGNLHVRVVGERGANQSNVLLNNGRSYTLPAYVMVDLTLGSLAFKPLGTAETVLSVTLRNLLDARPSEPYFGGFDLPTTGRSWIFEVRQKI